MINFQGRCFKIIEITNLIKETLESQFYSIKLEGEISNFKPSSSGHFYFSLKDSSSMISAVIFKNAAKNLAYIPADGDLVVVSGDISVYPQRGNYQIICSSLEKAGQGEILAELERRKKKFADEGLFDPEAKKPLPLLPQKIAVVTSPTGAAIKDILRVLKRRNNNISLIIMPAPVQGDDAAAKIAAQIRRANLYNIADVIIVGRGGGSLEDLLPFSDELVVRAIYNSEIPVISAVGHEIDTTLSDYAADYKAPTPSAAAEIVSVESTQLLLKLDDLKLSMTDSLQRKIQLLRLRMDNCTSERLAEIFNDRNTDLSRRFENSLNDITRTMNEKIKISKLKLELMVSDMKAWSPEAILEKGYAAVYDSETGSQIKSAFTAQPDKEINIRFYKDILTAKAITAEIIKEQEQQ